MARKSKKNDETMVNAKRVLRELLRNRRECGIGMYLMLLELVAAQRPLSGLALERRLKGVGLQNPRQEVTRANLHRWVRAIDEVDGKRVERCWELTETGRAVAAGILKRTGLRVEYDSEALEMERGAGERVREMQRDKE